MTGPLYVIPCSGKKLPHAAPAGASYLGSWHRLAREAADAIVTRDGGDIAILSAKYGLLDLDRVIEPYDLTIADLERKPKPGERDPYPGGSRQLGYEVAEQLIERGTTQLVLLLPTSYAHVMACAAISVSCSRGGPTIKRWWPLEGCTGVGYQRAQLAALRDGTDERDD